MKLFKFAIMAAAVSGMTLLSACTENEPVSGDETEQGSGTGEGTGTPSQPGKVLSPDESRSRLEAISNEVLGVFDANDQKELNDLCQAFADAGEFTDETMPGAKNYAVAKRLANAMRTCQYSNVQPETYAINFGDQTGIYSVVGGTWTRTGNSSDIVFQFAYRGELTELKISGTGTVQSAKIEDTYDDYHYDPGYNYHVEEITDTYNITCPEMITISLKSGGKEYVNVKSTIKVDQNAKVYALNTTGRIANIDLETITNLTGSKGTTTNTIKVGGKTIVTAKAEINGTGMTDENSYASDDANTVLNHFGKGTVSLDILGKLQVRGTSSNWTSIYKIGQQIDDLYIEQKSDYSYMMSKAHEYCDKFNQQFDAKFYYDNNSNAQGSFIVMPDLCEHDDYYYSAHVNLIGGIRFDSDGSKYSLSDFGDCNQFTNVTNSVENLIDTYRNIMKW